MTAQGGGGALMGAPPRAWRSDAPSLPWAALALLAFLGCGGHPGDAVRSALNAVAGRANDGYHTTVAACLAAERAALDASTTADQWTVQRDHIRPVCDTAIAAWERARTADEAAIAAVATCERAADQTCFDGALAVVTAAERAAEDAAKAWETARKEIERP